MRLLVLSDYYPPNTKGGADIAAERLSAEIARRGHEVRVLTTVQKREEVGEMQAHGVRIRRVFSDYPLRFRNYLAVHNPAPARAAAEEIRRFRPDVIHAHNIHTHLSYQSLLVARKLGVPIVLTAHDHQLFCAGKFACVDPSAPVRVPEMQCVRCQRFRYFPLRNRLIARAVRASAPKILAVSAALKADLVANGYEPATIQVVHNGLDPDSMDVGDDQVASFARRHALAGRRVVLFGGRVSEAKGIDQAVGALGRLPAEADFLFLVLGTSDDYVAYILQLGRRMSVEQQTVFLPWLSGDDLRAAYSLASIFLTPSVYREPFNLINLEAMALSKPVITTCFGGPPEVVVDGVTGYVVDPRDTHTLSARIAELLADEEKARAMGEAGRSRLLERFTVAQQADRILDVYGSLAGRAT